MKLLDQLIAVLVILIWGVNFYFMKLGVEDLSPTLLGFIRYLFVLFPFIFFVKKPAISWKMLFLYGFIGNFAQFAFIFSAVDRGLPTSLVALVVQSQVFFSILIAVFVLSETAYFHQWIALFLAFSGLGVVAIGQGESDIPMIGLVLVIASAFSLGIGNILTKKMGKVSPLGLIVWGNLLTPIWFLLFAIFQNGGGVTLSELENMSWKGWVSGCFLGYLATVAGYGGWIYLLGRYSVSRITPLALWVPVVSMLFGVVVLGERLNIWQWLGSMIIMMSLMLYIFGDKKYIK